MDVGEPIREIEVVPQRIPVPDRDPTKKPDVPTPKEREPAKNGVLNKH